MLAHSLLQFYARTFSDELFIQDAEQSFSFGSGQAEIDRIAALLLDQGLVRGNRAAIIGENSAYHLLMLFAAAKIGVVMVPLNYRLAVPELDYIIRDAEVKTLLATDAESAQKALAASIDGLPVFYNGKPMADTRNWHSCLQAQSLDPLMLNEATIDEHDTLMQLYTSGTTGRPKGVLLSHNNMRSLLLNTTAIHINTAGIGWRELLIAPLFHIGGLGSAVLVALSGGGLVLHKAFDPVAVVNTLEQQQINSVFMVPAMIQAIVNTVPNLDQRDFSHLKRINYGAAPISESLLRQAISVFNCEFVQLFGMTETCGGTLSLAWPDHQRALNGQPELLRSCGRGMADVSVKIVKPDGSTAPIGETGEIAIRSNSNMKGYWHLEAASAKTLRDGWVYTGDAGYQDAEGYFYLRDRLKDMVLTGGENVYPVEVENVLSAHPAILEIAIIGIPDEQYGEALLAVVVLQQGAQLNLDDLIAFGKQQLGGYKVPRQLKFIDALPRNPSGKTLKTVLREPYWQGRDRGIA